MGKKSSINKITLFDVINNLIFILILFIVCYPIYWIIIASISNPDLVNMGKVWLVPEGLNFMGYKTIFTFDTIWIGYRNSLIYTVLGTTINIMVTVTAGYALSRKDLAGRSVLMIILIIPMYFGGGLIPTYLLVNKLGILDSILAMILPNALSIFYVIISKAFFESTIPGELRESAVLDGCDDFKFFFYVILPLSKAIIAVLTVYYAAGHWNSYFQALIYLKSKNLMPLQIVLRDILIQNSTDNEAFMLNLLTNNKNQLEKLKLAQLIKYGIIIVSSVPLLILYPFVQKYFEKGVMIGSIKG